MFRSEEAQASLLHLNANEEWARSLIFIHSRYAFLYHKDSSIVLPRLGAWLMRDKAISVQHLDISMVPDLKTDQEHPHCHITYCGNVGH